MRSPKAWILALALSLPIAAATAEPAKAGASVSMSFFYDSLAPHGNWYVSADYGYVWRPFAVTASWRPYSDGRWVYSDYGWTFVSYASWGWGPYHYGRWYFDPYYGWVWVPGTEWAPAWVSFYEGPGWIGWAPLPPRVSYVSWRSGYIDPRAYVFVESRFFLDANIGHHVAPVSYNTQLVRTTRDITRFSRRGDAVVNVGPAVERVEKATRNRVRRYRLTENTDVARASSTRIRGDAVEVFRPRVTSRATHPPKVKEDRTRSGRDERAVAPDRGRSSTRVEKSTARPQVKPSERKQPEQKPPAVRSDARQSSRELRAAPTKSSSSRSAREQVTRTVTTTRKATTSRAADYRSTPTRDTRREVARSTRTSAQNAKVEREPRSSVSKTSSKQVRQVDRTEVSRRPTKSSQSTVDQKRAAEKERVEAGEAKAQASSKATTQKGKRQSSKQKPSNDRKPPRG